MCNRFTVVLLSFFIASFFLSACSTAQHTNTLVFGTNTKFAADISVASPPSQPSVTVGYARQEFVWMPLSMNLYKSDDKGKPQQEQCTKTPFSDCLYQGRESTNDVDAYSVFASFGNNTGSQGGVSIAQYFATGLAARHLASSPNSYKMVTAQPEGAVSEEIKKAALVQLTSWETKRDLILAYVQNDGKVDPARLATLTTGTGLDASLKKYENKDIADLRAALSDQYLGNIEALAKNIKTQ